MLHKVRTLAIAINGGGAVGAVYSFSEKFSIGGGIGARSQILDNVLIYPIIVLNWQITDRLLFSTRMTSGWANQTGAELSYELKPGVDVGVAAVFDYQRFRLSDGNAIATWWGRQHGGPSACCVYLIRCGRSREYYLLCRWRMFTVGSR